MSDTCMCDACGKIGRRKRWTIAPPNWYYLDTSKTKTQDGESGPDWIVYACSQQCIIDLFSIGPGMLSVGE